MKGTDSEDGPMTASSIISDPDPAVTFYVDKLNAARSIVADLGAKLNAGDQTVREALDSATDEMAEWWKLARAFGADVGDNAWGRS